MKNETVAARFERAILCKLIKMDSLISYWLVSNFSAYRKTESEQIESNYINT